MREKEGGSWERCGGCLLAGGWLAPEWTSVRAIVTNEQEERNGSRQWNEEQWRDSKGAGKEFTR